MLKYFFYFVLAAIVVGLLAGSVHLYKVAAKNKREMAEFNGEKMGYHNHLGKILVIYYSLSGHTKDIAERISLQTGADIYEIKTKENIKSNPLFYAKVKNQLKSGNYPEINDNFPDVSAYDLIIVGAPIWWYTAATPTLSFLKEFDFKGKKIAPFSTQGSNYGTYFEDFKKKAQNAEILEGAAFNNLPKEYDDAVDNKITAWLNNLGN